MTARFRLRGAFLALAVAGVVMADTEGTGGTTEVARFTDGLREPAAVEVLEDGAVVVADMSANTVTAFEVDGALRWRVDPGFDHPSGLGRSSADGVWVADAGHARLVRLSGSTGEILARVPLPGVHPTDVAEGAGDLLWVSATPEDRLLLVDRTGRTVLDVATVDGRKLRAPRGLAADRLGGVWVSLALDGQVLHLSRTGVLLGTVGAWGLGAGEFVKPKDVALLGPDALVVVDSQQGVAQVLGTDGTFRSLVQDGVDAIRLAHPLGVASFAKRIYVADAGLPGVRVLDPGGPAAWGGAFPRARVYFGSALATGGDPSGVCRQCHDGTRRLTAGNWDPMGRQHPTEVDTTRDLPAGFVAAADGTMGCSTCHAPHATRSTERPDVVTYGLDVPEEAAPELGDARCVACHAGYVDDRPLAHRRGHPVGLPLPEGAGVASLLDAGAVVEEGRVGCRTCHAPHGAIADPLLVLDTERGELCLPCHADHGPGESAHPTTGPMDPGMRARIDTIGGVLAPDGATTCLSCHDVHQSNAGALLRTAGSGAAACATCHEPEARGIGGGGHGRLGCGACHGMHEDSPPRGNGPRRAGVGPQACLDCHADDGDAPQVDPDGGHPIGVRLPGHGSLPAPDGRLACTTCHDPHGSDDRLLRDPSEAGCTSCHAAEGSVVGTDHDARVVPVAGSRQTCLSCHDVHGTDRPYLARVSGVRANPASGRCLACHDGSTPATPVERFDHPASVLTTATGLPVGAIRGKQTPYFGPDGERIADRQGEITCVTCHEPHRWKHGSDLRAGAVEGTEQDSFLRDPDEVVPFCGMCHGREGYPKFRFFHGTQVRSTSAGAQR